ncbi:hypothetical protein EJB05_01156, partial [Eragrostis curvula]
MDQIKRVMLGKEIQKQALSQVKWNFLRLLTRRKDNGQNAAARKLTLEVSDESGEQESRCSAVPTAKEDIAFQEAYKETTGTKSTKSHGHGYLANPTKNQLLKERIKEQEREVRILKEQLAKAAADKEADKASLKTEMKALIMEEMKAMLAQNMRQI